MPEIRDARIGTKEEALDRVRRAIDEGLIPLLGRAMGESAMFGVEDKGHFLSCCFCCTCCCVNGKMITYGPSIKRIFSVVDGVSVHVDENLCIGCGKCIEVCVFKGREMVDGKAKLIEDQCIGCGRCADICPTGATTIEIDDVSRVEDLIAKIEAVVDVRDQATLEE
jgi:UDP-glucose 4-epimerase